MRSEDPEDHYPLYPLGMLRRHGLVGAQDLSQRLPDWTERELEEWFFPARNRLRETETDLESHCSIDGGERVTLFNGHPLFVSCDPWCFEVVAGPELMDQLVAAMLALRG
ncbi:MAG: hypothetical protein ACREP7_06795 [Lysobacter sp.]